MERDKRLYSIPFDISRPPHGQTFDLTFIRSLFDRKHREQTGFFWAEGLRNFHTALRSGREVCCVVRSRQLLRSSQAEIAVRRLQKQGAVVIDVDGDQFASISRQEEPQGIGIVAPQSWQRLIDTHPRAEDLWVVLDNVRTAGNLGTILRTTAAVGANGVMLIGGETDPHDSNSIRGSMGAIFTQQLIRTSARALEGWRKRHHCRVIGTSPTARTHYKATSYHGPLLLMMGNERSGLRERQTSLCDVVVRLPMTGAMDSLNIARPACCFTKRGAARCKVIPSHDKEMLIQLALDANSRVREPNVLPPSAWGITRPTNRSQWNTAFNLYDRDQVVEANGVGINTGAGERGEYLDALQIMDAEARTSADSVITRINEWLEVEIVNTETRIQPAGLGHSAEAAIRDVWSTLGLRIGPAILVTILSDDAMLPAHVAISGYVSIKKPFAKYCIPSHALSEAVHLEKCLKQLAACHAAALISDSSAPPWLICASEAAKIGAVADEIRHGFCSGTIKWREPSHLNRILRGLQVDGDPIQCATDAQHQAILVGRYLIDEKGMKSFRDCLAYHSPASAFHYFVLLFSNDPTRDACKKYLGFAPEYLFEQALARCCK